MQEDDRRPLTSALERHAEATDVDVIHGYPEPPNSTSRDAVLTIEEC